MGRLATDFAHIQAQKRGFQLPNRYGGIFGGRVSCHDYVSFIYYEFVNHPCCLEKYHWLTENLWAQMHLAVDTLLDPLSASVELEYMQKKV